jgi:hypothetical protein
MFEKEEEVVESGVRAWGRVEREHQRCGVVARWSHLTSIAALLNTDRNPHAQVQRHAQYL